MREGKGEERFYLKPDHCIQRKIIVSLEDLYIGVTKKVKITKKVSKKKSKKI